MKVYAVFEALDDEKPSLLGLYDTLEKALTKCDEMKRLPWGKAYRYKVKPLDVL